MILENSKNLLNNDRYHSVTIMMPKKLVEAVDAARSKFGNPRTAWIKEAIINRLEKLDNNDNFK